MELRLLWIRDKDGNTVAEAPLIINDVEKAKQIWDDTIGSLPVSVDIGAGLSGAIACMERGYSYSLLVLTENEEAADEANN